MKSSDILKEVLHKFEHNYDSMFPGICDNLRLVLQNKNPTLYLSDLKLEFDMAMWYVKKYRPLEGYGMYWWADDDVQVRIEVLKQSIMDAIEAGD